MATSSNQAKSWNIYSTNYSPAKRSTVSPTATSTDEQASTTSRPSSEVVSYGRQRSVFPFGIVSEYDLKEAPTSSENNDKILPGNLTSTASGSSPCLSSSSPARWGTKILQTPPRSPIVEESFNSLQSTVSRARIRGQFRRRMYSCPQSTPVNDFLRVEVPNVSSIMVQAHSVPLVQRRSQPSLSKPLNATSTLTGSQRRPFERAASVPSIGRPKKTISDEKPSVSAREKAELSKSFSEVKIEDGVIIINNGKVIDLRKDRRRKHQQSGTKQKHAEAAKSQSYREFQDAMQKFEDAQLNLEGEVNTKAKSSGTREKEHQFFNENVQTQLLDLWTSVKEKRKSKGKKYRC